MRVQAMVLAVALAAPGALGMPARAAVAQERITLPDKDRPIDAAFETVFSVGSAEGEDWEMFGNVAAVAFDAADNLYVLDRQGARVLVFDASGEFVRQIGKKGGGPGELEFPLGLAVTADARIVVADAARGGFSLFDRDGNFLEIVSWGAQFRLPQNVRAHPRGGVLGSIRPMPMMPGRRVRAEGGGGRREGGAGPERAAPDSNFYVQWYALDGTSRPIAKAPAPQMNAQASSSASGQRVEVRVQRPPMFSPEFHWGPLPDGGLALAYTPAYSIGVMGADGQLERVLNRPIRPRPVTEADKKAALEQPGATGGGGIIMMRAERGGESRTSMSEPTEAQMRAALETTEFAEVMSVIRRLATDPFNRIWVERSGDEAFAPGPVDILSADGRYLGTVQDMRVPDAFSRSGRAAWIEEDELGVERVVVRKIPNIG